jgi:RHS repeat-associated protein
VTMNGVVAGQYSYNALGQRTHKLRTTATGTVQFVYHYDLGGRLIAETRPNGTLVRSYLWADDEPVAQIQNKPALAAEELVYLHTDALGTPRLATDATQTVVWRFESQAFGTGKPETDPDGNGVGTQVRLRFAGQYYDAESGLHYNWNRYYDPRTGRYVTSDPIGLEGGLNTYAYVLNNPAKYYDFSGLYPDCIRKFIGSKTNQHDDTYVTTIWYQNVPLPENPRLEVGPGAPREPPIKPSIVADWWMWQIALKNTKTYHVWEGTDFFKVTCVDVKECKKTEFSYIDSVPRPPIRQVTSDQNAWTRERLYFIGTYSF